MTRKSKKGIVGKALPTSLARYDVGPGIDFVEKRLRFGSEIESAIRDEKRRRGL